MTSPIVVILALILFTQTLSIPTTVRQSGAWCVCRETAGVCIDTDVYSCSSSTLSGLCPGASNILCCPYPGGVIPSSCSEEELGSCTRTENCPSSTLSGECPGPSQVKCCQNSPSPTAPPSGSFTPPPPDTSESLGSCTTPFNSFSGSCIDRAECTGGTFNDLCPGDSSILCCVAETMPVAAPPSNPLVSLSQFQTLFTNVSPTRASALHPYFLDSLSTASINNCLRIAAYSAQIGHESAGLLYFEEIADGSQYEDRTDLGNTEPGDGRRYKGRGPIQLTGRFNYRSAGESLGRAFESRPEEVGMPSGGFEAAAWFWRTRVDNADADAGTQEGFDKITVAINGCGGVITNCNGVTDRRNRWSQARQLLGC